MNRIRLATILATLVFALSVSVASAATDSGLGSTVPAAISNRLTVASSVYLIASFHPPEQARDISRDKNKNKDKEKFHGAEMSSSAVVIAGLLALTGYFLFIRRKRQTRA